MTSELSTKAGALLNGQQQLMLHQLQLTQWLEGRRQTALRKEQPKAEGQENREPVPDRWTLTKGINLYSWQNDCIRNWFDAGCRGTVKVVTGGGKTVLALAIAEQLQNRKDRDLRVAIVVPTIVLMNQWYEEFEQRSNLPMWAVGRLGGG